MNRFAFPVPSLLIHLKNVEPWLFCFPPKIFLPGLPVAGQADSRHDGRAIQKSILFFEKVPSANEN
jgi:hypothetical protein